MSRTLRRRSASEAHADERSSGGDPINPGTGSGSGSYPFAAYLARSRPQRSGPIEGQRAGASTAVFRMTRSRKPHGAHSTNAPPTSARRCWLLGKAIVATSDDVAIKTRYQRNRLYGRPACPLMRVSSKPDGPAKMPLRRFRSARTIAGSVLVSCAAVNDVVFSGMHSRWIPKRITEASSQPRVDCAF